MLGALVSGIIDSNWVRAISMMFASVGCLEGVVDVEVWYFPLNILMRVGGEMNDSASVAFCLVVDYCKAHIRLVES